MAISKIPSKMVSWEEIERWSEIIVEKIGNENFDSIISVIRGGLVPARIIADYLNIKDLYTLKTEHWGVTATPDGRAKVTHPVVIDLTGKKVLLVDDITDTGQSLRLAIDATKLKNPLYVKSATLLHIRRAEIVPDYFAEEITAENWKWFIFPWNRKEDLRNLVAGCIDGKMSLDEISDCLAKKHELYISKRELVETIDWLKNSGKIEIGEKISKII